VDRELGQQRAGGHPLLFAGPDPVELGQQRLKVVARLFPGLGEGDRRGGKNCGEEQPGHPRPPGPPGPPPGGTSPGIPRPNTQTRPVNRPSPTQKPFPRGTAGAPAKPTPISSAAQKWKRFSESSRRVSLGFATWTQAPTESGSKCLARSSVSPSCHSATSPHSARSRATGRIPTADALNSAGNGALRPISPGSTATATAVARTTQG